MANVNPQNGSYSPGILTYLEGLLSQNGMQNYVQQDVNNHYARLGAQAAYLKDQQVLGNAPDGSTQSQPQVQAPAPTPQSTGPDLSNFQIPQVGQQFTQPQQAPRDLSQLNLNAPGLPPINIPGMSGPPASAPQLPATAPAQPSLAAGGQYAGGGQYVNGGQYAGTPQKSPQAPQVPLIQNLIPQNGGPSSTQVPFDQSVASTAPIGTASGNQSPAAPTTNVAPPAAVAAAARKGGIGFNADGSFNYNDVPKLAQLAAGPYGSPLAAGILKTMQDFKPHYIVGPDGHSLINDTNPSQQVQVGGATLNGITTNADGSASPQLNYRTATLQQSLPGQTNVGLLPGQAYARDENGKTIFDANGQPQIINAPGAIAAQTSADLGKANTDVYKANLIARGAANVQNDNELVKVDLGNGQYQMLPRGMVNGQGTSNSGAPTPNGPAPVRRGPPAGAPTVGGGTVPGSPGQVYGQSTYGSAQDKNRADNDAKDSATYAQLGNDAHATLNRLNLLQGLLPQAKVNPGAVLQQNTVKALASAGIVKPDGTYTARQVIQQQSQALIGEVKSEIQGARLTQQEIQFLTNQLTKLDDTPEGFQKTLDIMRAIKQRDADVSTVQAKFATAPDGKIGGETFNQWHNRYSSQNPIFKP